MYAPQQYTARRSKRRTDCLSLTFCIEPFATSISPRRNVAYLHIIFETCEVDLYKQFQPLIMAFSPTVGTACVLIPAILAWAWLSRRKNSMPLPPGPKGLPFIGNVMDLPPPGVPEYQHWLKHKEQYGPLSSVTVLGQTMLIIHDKRVAFELMEKRASKYSGRPNLKFGIEM